MHTLVKLPNDKQVRKICNADDLQKMILKAAGTDAERAFIEYRKIMEDELLSLQSQIKDINEYVYNYKMAMDTLLAEIVKITSFLEGEFPEVRAGIFITIEKIKEWS